MYKRIFITGLIFTWGILNAQSASAGYEKQKGVLTIEKNTLRIKDSGSAVGYIKNNKIYTCFPRSVKNAQSYADITILLKFLNGSAGSRQGKWYLNTKNGELGYCQNIPQGMSAENAFKKYWNITNVYALYPEANRLRYSECPVEYTIYTLQKYPLSQRTAASLRDIEKITSVQWKNKKRKTWKKTEGDFEVKKITMKKPDFTGDGIDGDADYYRFKGEKAMFYSVDLPILYFTLSAMKGDWHSQRKLAWLLEEKREQDEKYIFSLYKKAAEKGYCKCCSPGLAEIDLARCYWHGIGTEVNHKKAFELASEFLKAHPKSRNAMLIVGMWYVYETPEKKKGMELISKAENGGFMSAILERCIINEYGLAGIPQQICYASNFGYIPPANTVYAWLAGYFLNARDYERWVKSGGTAGYLAQ